MKRFDTIFVGTGFASCFFLAEYLKYAKNNERVLVLERGGHDSHDWQREHQRNSKLQPSDTFVNTTPDKEWIYSPGLGGGSNCWWACTPRLMPNDFAMKATYGVGQDWPLSYDDLSPFYDQAEDLMSVSGPDNRALFPRSGSYPQPPHRFTDPDRLLKASYPDLFFEQPTARARRATRNRSACCASGVCRICPVDAKFTILNEMTYLFEDPRVELSLHSTAEFVVVEGGRATGVHYRKEGRSQEAHGDLVILGANALFNAHLLSRSALAHPLLGRNLHEQAAIGATIDLDGVDNFQGSTSVTGHGYMHYDGSHRSHRAGCLIESFNVPSLRLEPGKWRQRLKLKFIFEDLPQLPNRVEVDPDRPDLPVITHKKISDYAQRSLDRIEEIVEETIRPLPVEGYRLGKVSKTEAHILGTVPMGADPKTSIVDRHLVHHRVRNLVVLGGSAFPTSSPANPTLTIAALSLWSARALRGA